MATTPQHGLADVDHIIDAITELARFGNQLLDELADQAISFPAAATHIARLHYANAKIADLSQKISALDYIDTTTDAVDMATKAMSATRTQRLADDATTYTLPEILRRARTSMNKIDRHQAADVGNDAVTPPDVKADHTH